MAIVHRKRVIHNPARKRRRRLTAKQIAAGFGGKRRQAAVKANRHRKRTRPNRSARPVARRRPAARRRHHRRARANPGEILSLSLAGLNPSGKKRRKTVARRRKARSNRRRSGHAHRRVSRRRVARTNPVARYTRRRRRRSGRVVGRRRARRNPGASMARGGFGSMLTASAWAVAGGVGTVAGTEAILGAKNTGILGYGANFLLAIILGQVVSKGMKNPRAGGAVTMGGAVATILRIIRDRTPFGQYVNQAFGQSGIGDWGVGEYIQSTAFQPMQIQSNQWPAQVMPAVIQNLQARAAAPAMQGLGRRSAGSRMDMTRF